MCPPCDTHAGDRIKRGRVAIIARAFPYWCTSLAARHHRQLLKLLEEEATRRVHIHSACVLVGSVALRRELFTEREGSAIPVRRYVCAKRN